jgi:hypothetical protein
VPMRVDLKFGRNWGDAQHTWEELQGSPAPAITVKAATVTAGKTSTRKHKKPQQPVSQQDIDEINAGLVREGIEPAPWSSPALVEVLPGSAEFAAILASLSEEDRIIVRPQEAVLPTNGAEGAAVKGNGAAPIAGNGQEALLDYWQQGWTTMRLPPKSKKPYTDKSFDDYIITKDNIATLSEDANLGVIFKTEGSLKDPTSIIKKLPIWAKL